MKLEKFYQQLNFTYEQNTYTKETSQSMVVGQHAEITFVVQARLK